MKYTKINDETIKRCQATTPHGNCETCKASEEICAYNLLEEIEHQLLSEEEIK